MKKNPRTPLYIGIIIIILILAALSFHTRSTGDPYYSQNTYEHFSNDDSDGDGLKDWEEVLWKTNSNNPDTDGDGTDDGTEVSLGRDPIVSGPDDHIPGIVFYGSQTDEIALDLLSTYVTDNSDSEKTIEEVVDEVIEKTLDSNTERPFAKVYTLEDISLRGGTIEDYHAYGNTFAQLLSSFNNIPDEISIITYAMQANDPDELVKLDITIEYYKNFLSQLLQTATPKSLRDTHLELVNTVSSLIADMSGMKLLFTDTIIAAESISNYYIHGNEMQNNIILITQKIIESGVTYSTEEIGYGLLNIL